MNERIDGALPAQPERESCSVVWEMGAMANVYGVVLRVDTSGSPTYVLVQHGDDGAESEIEVARDVWQDALALVGARRLRT